MSRPSSTGGKYIKWHNLISRSERVNYLRDITTVITAYVIITVTGSATSPSGPTSAQHWVNMSCFLGSIAARYITGYEYYIIRNKYISVPAFVWIVVRIVCPGQGRLFVPRRSGELALPGKDGSTSRCAHAVGAEIFWYKPWRPELFFNFKSS